MDNKREVSLRDSGDWLLAYTLATLLKTKDDGPVKLWGYRPDQ